MKGKTTALVKAKSTATKKEDKYQNEAISRLQRSVSKLRKSQELKLADNFNQVPALTLNNNGSIWRVTTLDEGTDYNQRIGLNVNIRSIQMRYLAASDVTNYPSGVSCTRWRIIVFRDMENTIPAPTDLLQALGGGIRVSSPLNHINLERFKIYYDNTFVHSLNGTNATERKMFKKIGGAKCTYSGPSNLNIDSGQIYVFIINDLSSSITNVQSLEYFFRIRYTD